MKSASKFQRSRINIVRRGEPGDDARATAFCSESNREGTNILVVKGTTQTGMKDIRAQSSAT